MWPDLVDEFARIRTRGFAIDSEENTIGICCFAVSVGDARPRTDAISCSVPVARLTRDLQHAILDALQTAVDRLTTDGRRLQLEGLDRARRL